MPFRCSTAAGQFDLFSYLFTSDIFSVDSCFIGLFTTFVIITLISAFLLWTKFRKTTITLAKLIQNYKFKLLYACIAQLIIPN
mgnify:CR=1 FL=1